MVVAKYNVKNNSSKTIAEFPGMTIKTTFEHQGMWIYLSTKAGASFIFFNDYGIWITRSNDH